MKKLEISRKIAHIVFGLIVLALILSDILTPARILLILIFGFILSVISIKYKLPIVGWFLKNFERDEHLHLFPGKGIIFFLVGALLVMKLFDRDIALAAVAILTFGDGISHLVGRGLGKIKFPLNGSKNIEGLIAGIIAGSTAAAFFIPVASAVFGASVGMGVEAIGLKMGNTEVDDNVIVPLVSGTAIYLFNTGFRVFI